MLDFSGCVSDMNNPVTSLKSYWNGSGLYQEYIPLIQKLIPREGAITGENNEKLELYRRAVNCYYDLYNNGLCNRGAEFVQLFPRLQGARMSKTFLNQLESRMNRYIEGVIYEQDITLDDLILEGVENVA